MRLIMMGTGPFAVPTFKSLIASTHTVDALVTRPPVTVPTRGKLSPPPNPMREVADAHGIPVQSPADVNATESRQAIASLNPDLYVVCDYGQILSKETLSIPRCGGINLHGSLLPKYRGAAPVNWAIWKGEQETGVTVLHMTPKLDAGPSLVQIHTKIEAEETAAELEPRLALMGIGAVHQSIQLLQHWDGASPIGSPQENSLASRAPRLKKSDGDVNWKLTAAEIHRQFRALQPWPGLFTHLLRAGQPLLRLILEKIAPHPINLVGGTPGLVMVSDGRQLIIAAGQQAIAIHRLQPAGKRSMDVMEFLRGYRIEPGEFLGSGA